MQGEEKYSLVLEYAEGGTLRNYLRDNTINFKWEDQLRFAKEIASAILWIHDVKKIIHGDLHPNNILIHKDTIKLADFGRSCQKELECYNTEVRGVIPYVDPKILGQKLPYKLNEKSDIYSLGVLFWELTSRKSPFNGLEDNIIMLKILNGLREEPVPNTNVEFVGLYQECWKQEPNERPHISKVNEVLNIVESENNEGSTSFFKKSEAVETMNELEIDEEINSLKIAENKKTPHVAEQLGDRKVLPIEDIKILSELDHVSDSFWDKYEDTSLSYVSPAMVDEKVALIALVRQPKDTPVYLPGEFKGYPVFISYGEIEPAHRSRHNTLKPGISIGNHDATFTLGSLFRREDTVDSNVYLLTVEHGVRNSSLLIQPGSEDNVRTQ